MAEFTHLHLHTDYSLLDGACDVEKLVAHVDSIGQKAVAITDHGNIYGAVHFFEAATARGIKPILGCELYIARGSMTSKLAGDDSPKTIQHMTVLAKNETGYRNLLKVATEASLTGYYYNVSIANKLNARAVLIIGDDELAKGVAQLKDLDSGEQREVALDALADALKA